MEKQIQHWEKMVKHHLDITPAEVLKKADVNSDLRMSLATFIAKQVNCKAAVVAEYMRNNLKEYLKAL